MFVVQFFGGHKRQCSHVQVIRPEPLAPLEVMQRVPGTIHSGDRMREETNLKGLHEHAGPALWTAILSVLACDA